MKKISLLFIAIVMQSGMVCGQSVVRTALVEDLSGYACGIFRSWGSTKALAYHEHGGEYLFSVIDSASLNVYSAKVPEFYRIRDFRIVGDTAYCGGASHDTAMLAYFNIRDIINGGPINFHVSPIDKLQMITRLVAYRNRFMNGVGIAAIGEEVQESQQGLYSISGSYMVWCDNFSSGIFHVEIEECDNSWDLTTPSEKLNDVVVTANYVAFVGIYTNTNTKTIRRGDWNGIFSNSLIDTVHQFQCIEGVSTSLPIAEPLDRDTIAIAIDLEDYWGDQVAQVRLIDISSMAMTNAQQTTLGGMDKCALIEMIYMKNRRKLLLAVESSTGDRIIYVEPMASVPYSAKTLAPATGDMICSMDRHNENYYILSTLKHWMLQRMGNMPASNSCVTQDQQAFYILTVCIDRPKEYSDMRYGRSFTLRKLNPMNFHNSIYCSNIL